ncbi:MAG TPA: YbhB/YbcL family Raf kinase inhibitor-like protein [Actinomycetota bacterium]|jgi:Raf kinase inhibitor-like YbhB/YbcL family protein|nr:YbhB/YbcL family Raf kinase inhibitor-like protein [Actinomycetota bacterium]
MTRALLVLVAGLIAACGGNEELPEVDAEESLAIQGPFEDGDAIPETYTCDGEDVSPRLAWEAFEGADEYALIMSDPDAPGGTFVHWVVFGLPADQTALDEGAQIAEANTGTNSSDTTGYSGPCPPEGDGPHRYEFTVYALVGAPNDLEPGTSAVDLLDAIDDSVRASGTLTGTYGR